MQVQNPLSDTTESTESSDSISLDCNRDWACYFTGWLVNCGDHLCGAEEERQTVSKVHAAVRTMYSLELEIVNKCCQKASQSNFKIRKLMEHFIVIIIMDILHIAMN